MTKISTLLAARRCVSVELWPPRTEAAAMRLTDSLRELERLHPDFASITYGAGGSTRDRTHDLVVEIERKGGMASMAHLVCAAHSVSELTEILTRYRDAGVENVLALRGDPPLRSDVPLASGELETALELVALARSIGPFCIAVAAHPSGHPDAVDLASDRRRLAEKVRAADFAITQFFYRVEDYLRLVDDLSALGVDKPIIPGIMPISNMRTIENMALLSRVPVPDEIVSRVESVGGQPEEVRKVGVDIATSLCERLLEQGVPGLHFYTMNQVSATFEICDRLGLTTHR